MITHEQQLSDDLLRASERGPSMDVLLQLTLPIILILAFLVVIEVESLRQQVSTMQQAVETKEREITYLEQDIRRTPTGEMRRELDAAIITLQHQLLLKATDEIAQEERDRLGLSEYQFTTPSIDEVLAQQINERFAEISRQLAAGFDAEGLRSTRERLRGAVLKRFKELVDEFLARYPGFGEARRHKLTDLSKEILEVSETNLEGHIEGMAASALEVQIEFVLQWIANPRVGDEIEAKSKAAWIEIQEAKEVQQDEIVGDQVKRFADLRVQDLIERLNELGAPVLSDIRREVL